ncbi:MAG: HAD-IB family phosphatase [Candidatus Thermoplasmatota archaeon]|nr:HAD-IB family phosphatase [Candidatus Thermoplasmatota archaeon]MCL5438142.1 HAD-IB family phosphatase [Candidatus Thermoplasmatota archaeon]
MPANGRIRLVAFDMDGVLTRVRSSWSFVHERLGVDNTENHQRYLNGVIDYHQFMVSDVDLWMKKHGRILSSTIKGILREIPLRRNVVDIVSRLRENGITSAIVSGGISWLSDIINEGGVFDLTFSNELVSDSDGYLTRNCIPHVIPDKKGKIIEALRESLGLDVEECASIGDSAMDRSMFEACGTSVAFNPEDEKVSEYATDSIVSDNLLDLIPYLLP